MFETHHQTSLYRQWMPTMLIRFNIFKTPSQCLLGRAEYILLNYCVYSILSSRAAVVSLQLTGEVQHESDYSVHNTNSWHANLLELISEDDADEQMRERRLWPQLPESVYLYLPGDILSLYCIL